MFAQKDVKLLNAHLLIVTQEDCARVDRNHQRIDRTIKEPIELKRENSERVSCDMVMFNACFYNKLKALESKFTSKTQWFTTESNKKK